MRLLYYFGDLEKDPNIEKLRLWEAFEQQSLTRWWKASWPASTSASKWNNHMPVVSSLWSWWSWSLIYYFVYYYYYGIRSPKP